MAVQFAFLLRIFAPRQIIHDCPLAESKLWFCHVCSYAYNEGR
jgi:hypothetical protein